MSSIGASKGNRVGTVCKEERGLETRRKVGREGAPPRPRLGHTFPMNMALDSYNDLGERNPDPHFPRQEMKAQGSEVTCRESCGR